MKFRFGFTKFTVGIERSHRLLGANPRLHSECPGAKLISACVLSLFSSVQFFATPWTVACRVPLSTGFSRQEYWSGLPLPPPDLSNSEIKYTSPASPVLQADSLPTELPQKHSWSLVNWKLSHKGYAAAAAAKSFQSCPTVWDPIDGSPPGSPVPGILQARILERVAISFSSACKHAKSLQSCPTLCNPIDGSSPGSSVPGILQARILEWVAISFSNARMHTKSLQSSLTLWDPMDSSPPGSSVHGIL